MGLRSSNRFDLVVKEALQMIQDSQQEKGGEVFV
jgi:hypothetical protein